MIERATTRRAHPSRDPSRRTNLLLGSARSVNPHGKRLLTSNGNASAAANGSTHTDLTSRLSSPETAQLLLGILDKLDVVHFALSSLDGFLQRGESIADNIADGVGELRGVGDTATIEALGKLAQSAPELCDTLDKLRPALSSDGFAKLVDPQTIDALGRLTERAELLAFAAEAAEGFLKRGEVIADAAAAGVRDLRSVAGESAAPLTETLAQIGKLLPGLQSLLRAVTPLVESGAIDALAQSQVLAPEVVHTIGNLGDALHATRVREAENPTRLGLFGLLKMMRDPDVQRALGFTSTFLKEFGRRLG